jgi:hypothetical protein
MCFPDTNSLIISEIMDCGKAALLFATLALQLHMLSISFHGYYFVPRYLPGENIPDLAGITDRDNAVKAFLILAFFSFIAAQVLLLLMNFTGDFRGNRIVGILVMAILIFAGILNETTKRTFRLSFEHECHVLLSGCRSSIQAIKAGGPVL